MAGSFETDSSSMVRQVTFETMNPMRQVSTESLVSKGLVEYGMKASLVESTASTNNLWDRPSPRSIERQVTLESLNPMRQVTCETLASKASVLRPEGGIEVGVFAEMLLFSTFIATRAIHPYVLENAKEWTIVDGQEKLVAPYAKMVPVLGECLFTFIVGQVMALCTGGVEAWKSIWNPLPLKVFCFIGLIQAWGNILEVLAISRVSGDAYQVLWQCKLLVTAVMMRSFKGATTTRFQWILLAVVTCSMSVYSTAGSRVKPSEIDPKYYEMTVRRYVALLAADAAKYNRIDAQYLMGIALLMAKVIVSCLNAVLSDKYMKTFKDEPIYVQLVQFKITWFLMVLLYTVFDGETWTEAGPLKGWNGNSSLVLASYILVAWSTMYLLAIMDSLLKNIGEAASVLVSFMLSIYVFRNKQFELGTFLTVVVVTLSVVSYIDSKLVVAKSGLYDEAMAT